MCVSGFCCFFSVRRAHLLRRVLRLLPGACCSRAPLAFRAVERAAGARTLLPRVLLSAVPASVTARPAAGFARFVGWWEHSEAGGRKIPELGSSDWPQWASLGEKSRRFPRDVSGLCLGPPIAEAGGSSGPCLGRFCPGAHQHPALPDASPSRPFCLTPGALGELQRE